VIGTLIAIVGIGSRKQNNTIQTEFLAAKRHAVLADWWGREDLDQNWQKER
jgi:hypothetical protein